MAITIRRNASVRSSHQPVHAGRSPLTDARPGIGPTVCYFFLVGSAAAALANSAFTASRTSFGR